MPKGPMGRHSSSYHRSIKRSPVSVKINDSVDLWKLQYQSTPKTTKTKFQKLTHVASYKFKVGDLVRVSFIRRQFQGEYDERWSRELFVVNGRFMRENIPQYQLKDDSREIVSGSFYQNQLIKAYEQETYMVVVVVLLFYVHGKHLRSCRDGQLT